MLFIIIRSVLYLLFQFIIRAEEIQAAEVLSPVERSSYVAEHRLHTGCNCICKKVLAAFVGDLSTTVVSLQAVKKTVVVK